MKVIDKDCLWKLVDTPIITVKAYINSLPDDAIIKKVGEDYMVVQEKEKVGISKVDCGYPYEIKLMTRDFLWTEIKWGKELPYKTFDGNQQLYGYFEQWSDETDYHCEGGLWYSFRNKRPILDDYDGVFSLPAEVKAFLIGAGFEVDESA